MESWRARPLPRAAGATVFVTLAAVATWMPLAGGQGVEPVFLGFWWGIAAVTLGAAYRIATENASVLPVPVAAVWLVMAALTLAGSLAFLNIERAHDVAANIAVGAAAIGVLAGVGLIAGLRARRA